MFGWFKRHRRKKILAQPWPKRWSIHLNRNVRLSWGLDSSELEALQRRIQVFVAEKNWEGCDGLSVTEEMRVTIAANASLMLLGTKDFYFDNVKTILIFPKSFGRQTRDGVVHGGTEFRSGEAWQGGPIVLSWQNVLRGGRNEDDGHNVVIHEFAHALDGLDGEMGGNISFNDSTTAAEWAQVLEHEFAELTAAHHTGRRTLLDPYGAKNPAEFFAVASETFFEMPLDLSIAHPELFGLLQTYYRIDPGPWQQR